MSSFYNFYVLYGDKLGFVDLESISKIIQNRLCDKIIVFLSSEPHENIKKILNDYPQIELRLASNPRKEAKKYKKLISTQNANMTSVLYPLETIADRSIWHDVC